MTEGNPPEPVHFLNEIERLSRLLLEERQTTSDSILRQAVDRLAAISPINSAGVLQMPDASGGLAYSHWQGNDVGIGALNAALRSHEDSLNNALTNQTLVAFRLRADRSIETSFLTGLPAGSIDQRGVALVLVSDRELTDRERAQLLLLGRLIGQSAENARVQQTMIDEERQRAVSLIGLIAHELRTPLTGLRGNIQLALMATRNGRTERIPNRLESAIRGVDAMTALVQSLLDVSHLERGTYQFDRSMADLNMTARRAVNGFTGRGNIEADRITLTTTEPVPLTHDREAFERAIESLLRVVTRYSSDNPVINVSVTTGDDELRLVIAYSGERFSTLDQQALVAPVYGERDKSEEGRGDALPLDLAFARGVIGAHGGEVKFTSPDDSGEHNIVIRIPN